MIFAAGLMREDAEFDDAENVDDELPIKDSFYATRLTSCV